MTDKEYEVKQAEFCVKVERIRAREAKVEMEEGYKKLRANMEMKYENLKASYELALSDLAEAELALERCKENAAKNYD
jgi:cytidylate kinase